jgi:hypothetical protein
VSSHGVMPHRSGTLQLSNVMFLTRDLTVSVLSRVVSQAVKITSIAKLAK